MIDHAPVAEVHEMKTEKWLAYVKEGSTHGQSIAKDKWGTALLLEWKKTDIQSPLLADFKKSVCELACDALVPAEVEFLKAHPEAVSQELFLKSCAPLFEKGPESVNWKKVEETIRSTMKQFYLIDLSSFGPAVIQPLLDDVYFLVSLKDHENTLGFMMCAITPALLHGHVKMINIAISPEAKNRGLEPLLMSSVFKILPKTQQIFLFVRPTNNKALEQYTSWGFAQNPNPIKDPNHPVDMRYMTLLEYKAEQSNTLQKTAAGLE